jgi:hypothetical protein
MNLTEARIRDLPLGSGKGPIDAWLPSERWFPGLAGGSRHL